MKCECTPECEQEITVGDEFVHLGSVVEKRHGAEPHVRPVHLGHLYNLQRAAADAIGADKGPRAAKGEKK